MKIAHSFAEKNAISAQYAIIRWTTSGDESIGYEEGDTLPDEPTAEKVPDTKIWETERDFWREFTVAEREAVERLVLVDRDTKAAVFLRTVGMPGVIHANDPDVLAAKDYLLAVRDASGHDALPTAERWGEVLGTSV